MQMDGEPDLCLRLLTKHNNGSIIVLFWETSCSHYFVLIVDIDYKSLVDSENGGD